MNRTFKLQEQGLAKKSGFKFPNLPGKRLGLPCTIREDGAIAVAVQGPTGRFQGGLKRKTWEKRKGTHRAGRIKMSFATNGVPENQRLPIIDRAALQALRDGVGQDGLVSFNELFATFLENATKLLDVTSWAAKAGDRAALQLAAHTLQLMGAAFGAERLSRLCRELEQMGKQGNLGEAEAKATQAKAAFSDMRREIQTHWLIRPSRSTRHRLRGEPPMK